MAAIQYPDEHSLREYCHNNTTDVVFAFGLKAERFKNIRLIVRNTSLVLHLVSNASRVCVLSIFAITRLVFSKYCLLRITLCQWFLLVFCQIVIVIYLAFKYSHNNMSCIQIQYALLTSTPSLLGSLIIVSMYIDWVLLKVMILTVFIYIQYNNNFTNLDKGSYTFKLRKYALHSSV